MIKFMKNVVKWGLIGLVGLFVLFLVFGNSSDDSFDKGKEAGLQSVDVVGQVLISGKDEDGEIVAEEINVWQKAGSGGSQNVVVGRIPHNAQVDYLDTEEVEGNIFYHIRSSIGKVSVLPTEFAVREKKMKELPESEWFVVAADDFLVDGWVIDSFIVDLQ